MYTPISFMTFCFACYAENVSIWRQKYGGSTIRWIKESVAPNLEAWGFNTVGWVQEVTVRKWRHSRAFTADKYRALDMPSCHSHGAWFDGAIVQKRKAFLC